MAKIGIIGLGALGGAMARRALALGHEVVGYNRSPDKAAALADDGLQPAASAAAACDADIVFSVLLNDAAVREILVENDPFGDHTAAVHISVSTISVPLVRALADRHAATGQSFVSAPVFGRPDNIHDASAVFAVGGAAEAVVRCHDALAGFGQTSFYERFGALLAAQGGNAPAINPFANSARLIAQTSDALAVDTPLADALVDALDRPL